MVHRRLLALAGQLRGPLAAGVLIGWLVMAARVTQAGLIGVVLGRIFAGRPFSDVTGLLWVIAAVVIIRGTLVWGREVVAQAAAGRIKERVRDRLYGKLLRLGPGYLTTTRSGEVQTTVVDGVEALEAYFSRYAAADRVSVRAGLPGGLDVHPGCVGRRRRVDRDSRRAAGSKALGSTVGHPRTRALGGLPGIRR